MKRVLVIDAAGNLWGSERALIDLLKGMSHLDVAVCCPPQRPLVGELEKLQIRALPYYVYGLHEKSKWQRLRAALGVLRACLEFRPDVIYLNQSGSYKMALLAATLLRLPLIAHIRIFEDAAYLAQQHPDARRLRGLIAISAAIEQEIRQFPELQKIPLHRIYDAYDPWNSSLPPEPAEAPISRVACVGRLVAIKGQDVLINAMGLLQESRQRVECLIIGDGENGYVQELKQTALRRKIDSSIQWLGFVGDVVPLLRTCSVLVCPSHREPLGRVIFEAWDAGVIPIVFAGSGGAAEVVAASQGGFLYDSQDPQALAQTVEQALALDQEQHARLVRNGRSWMATNCNPASYGERVATILLGAC